MRRRRGGVRRSGEGVAFQLGEHGGVDAGALQHGGDAAGQPGLGDAWIGDQENPRGMAVAAESGQIVAQLVDPPFPVGDPDGRGGGEFLGHRSAFRNLGMRENMIQSLAIEGFPARPMSSLAARSRAGGGRRPCLPL